MLSVYNKYKNYLYVFNGIDPKQVFLCIKNAVIFFLCINVTQRSKELILGLWFDTLGTEAYTVMYIHFNSISVLSYLKGIRKYFCLAKL